MIKLLNEGNIRKRKADILNCGQNTVIYINKKYNETGSVANLRKCEHSHSKSTIDDRQVRQRVLNMRRIA